MRSSPGKNGVYLVVEEFSIYVKLWVAGVD